MENQICLIALQTNKINKKVITPLIAAVIFLSAYFLVSAATISDVDCFKKNDGSLNFYLRSAQIENDLFENEFGGFDDGNKLGGHAVGATLDCSLPYLADFFGFDVSSYVVGKVDAEKDYSGLSAGLVYTDYKINKGTSE